MTETLSQQWSDEGVYPVSEGVYRVPLPLPMDALTAVNVYIVETEAGLTVIDGGWNLPASRAIFERALAKIGRTTRDITQFLVTHAHRDHYTQAAALAAELGCTLRLGAGESQSLAILRADPTGGDVHIRALESAGAQQLIPGWRQWLKEQPTASEIWPDPTTWLTDDESIATGDRRLRAIATPGHTLGHFVFADEQAGLLYAGDHILPRITPSVAFEPACSDLPLRNFLDSLAKVRRMPDMILLGAHGPIAPSSHARIDELVLHHDHRFELCVRAVDEGAATAYEVADNMPWTRRNRRLAELEPCNAALAVVETQQHLDLLAASGRLHRQDRDGVVRWSPVSAAEAAAFPTSAR